MQRAVPRTTWAGPSDAVRIPKSGKKRFKTFAPCRPDARAGERGKVGPRAGPQEPGGAGVDLHPESVLFCRPTGVRESAMQFVIVASPRTGSSHLTDLLNNQPDILCNGEVFHRRRVFVRWPKGELEKKAVKKLTETRDKDPAAFKDYIFSKNFGRAHVGFKIFNNQNNIVLRTVLDERDILKIILYRRNVLAIYSSFAIAGKTGKWNLSKSSEDQEQQKTIFDPQKFLNFHNRYTNFYRRVLNRIISNGQSFHFLNYDEINDPILFNSLVTSITGIAVEARLESGHAKQNSSDILSRFSNPAEVEGFLAARGLMHWAYEGNTSLELLSASPAAAELTHEGPS
jgi:LPS sulfotransferase NodH